MSIEKFGIIAVVIVIIYIIFMLMHFNSIEREVRKTSRCIQERNLGQRAGTYVVTAKDSANNDLYRVGYDFTARQTSVECACKEGKVANTYRDIPIYNLGTKTIETIKEKPCLCETAQNDNKQEYFYGYPGLVSFMNSKGKETTFFDTVLMNSM